jgi:tetratricopeptide (TPR) repeat protein
MKPFPALAISIVVLFALTPFVPAAEAAPTAILAPVADAAALYQRCAGFMAEADPGHRALTACQKAIAADPAEASPKLLGDECLLFYKEMDVDQAVPECDLAITAEPDRADLYFVKGSVLFTDATMSDGRLVVPPAAIAALKKYLALAPNGDHADYVKAMLATAR